MSQGVRGYGSLQNLIGGEALPDTTLPKVGDKATVFMYTDRHAHTVIGVKENPKRSVITIQRDKVKLASGEQYFSDAQKWDTFPNPDGPTQIVTFRQGQWRTKGGSVVRFGFAEEFQDPSF